MEKTCLVCNKTLGKTKNPACCAICGAYFHIKHAQVGMNPSEWNKMKQTERRNWKCSRCNTYIPEIQILEEEIKNAKKILEHLSESLANLKKKAFASQQKDEKPSNAPVSSKEDVFTPVRNGARPKSSTIPESVEVKNRFSSLKTDDTDPDDCDSSTEKVERPKQKKKNKLVVVADSHGRDCGLRLYRNLPELETTVFALRGRRMKTIVDSSLDVAKEFEKEDHCIILGGTNDMGHYRLPDFRADLMKLVDLKCKREVITIHTGQAGVQLGTSLWDLTCREHKIDPEGKLKNPDDEKEDLGSFFHTMPQGNLSPRAVLIDLEPTVIDQVRTGAYRNLFMPKSMLSGKEDAANNFARGYMGESMDMMPRLVETVRGQAEACEKLQGFMLYHSFGGGTGSGLHSRIIESLSDEYRKLCKVEVAIFPSPTMATAVVEPYNCVFATNATLEDTDCVFLADNEAIYDICQSRLDIDSPNYGNLNRLLAQTVSSITASLRYPGTLNADFTDFQTNLVPYPRIHFPVISYAPIVPKHSINKEAVSVLDITNRCFEHHNRLVKCDTTNSLFMACVLLYRGNIVPKDINEAIHMIKTKKDIRFVGWSPTGFKVGINGSSPGYLDDGDLGKADKALCVISNTTSIRDAWARINHQFHLMFSKRAFVHWFLQERMELEDMVAAQENLLALEQDYESLTDD